MMLTVFHGEAKRGELVCPCLCPPGSLSLGGVRRLVPIGARDACGAGTGLSCCTSGAKCQYSTYEV